MFRTKSGQLWAFESEAAARARIQSRRGRDASAVTANTPEARYAVEILRAHTKPEIGKISPVTNCPVAIPVSAVVHSVTREGSGEADCGTDSNPTRFRFHRVSLDPVSSFVSFETNAEGSAWSSELDVAYDGSGHLSTAQSIMLAALCLSLIACSAS